ncbi:2-dehydro-3-deoxygalactonokinase [Roseibium sp.]|uniref:2-dehydro-3-deoxygalactonokinase n=1 Tax=Roseibium sp. TaxID=1936156 RepID=UPI003A987709
MTIAAPLPGLSWIAVDWGTSSVRAWALDQDGTVLAGNASQEGMGGLSPTDYEPALLRLVEAWLPANPTSPVHVVICGMAGANQGWQEAPYRQIPCPPVTAGNLTSVPVRDKRVAVSIVPGICQIDPADVMRGEETQLGGLIASKGLVDATVCLPGTHSKWVRLEKGAIVELKTVMTGELFSIIANQSILRHSVGSDGQDPEAFEGAMREMLQNPVMLTSALFSIRANGLLQNVDASTARSRLSGLLIGAELAATKAHWTGKQVHLIGAGPLVDAYAVALGAAGSTPIREDAEQLTLAGLKQVHASMQEVTT